MNLKHWVFFLTPLYAKTRTVVSCCLLVSIWISKLKAVWYRYESQQRDLKVKWIGLGLKTMIRVSLISVYLCQPFRLQQEVAKPSSPSCFSVYPYALVEVYPDQCPATNCRVMSGLYATGYLTFETGRKRTKFAGMPCAIPHLGILWEIKRERPNIDGFCFEHKLINYNYYNHY